MDEVDELERGLEIVEIGCMLSAVVTKWSLFDPPKIVTRVYLAPKGCATRNHLQNT